VTRPGYVLVKGTAGLGNRIFALLSAALYARLASRRLVVDWSDPSYSNDRSNVVHRFFHSPVLSPLDELPDTASVRPSVWRGRLHRTAMELVREQLPELVTDPLVWRHYSFELARLDHQEELLVMWTYYPLVNELRRHFHGEFSTLRELDDDGVLRRLMRETLELHPAIRQRVDDVRSSWPAGPLIGVHLRHTDKVTNEGSVRRRLDALLRRHAGARVYLATDSRAMQERLAGAYPDLLTMPKWYPAGGKLHESRECRDRTENGIEALTELYLLSGCDHLVVDRRSAFSRLAVILSNPESCHVHDVNPWRAIPPRLSARLWQAAAAVKWGRQRMAAGHNLSRLQ